VSSGEYSGESPGADRVVCSLLRYLQGQMLEWIWREKLVDLCG